jgi:hypothetical protein
MLVLIAGIVSNSFGFMLTNGLLGAFGVVAFAVILPIFAVVSVIQLLKDKNFAMLALFLAGFLTSSVLFVSPFIFRQFFMHFRIEFIFSAALIFLITLRIACRTKSYLISSVSPLIVVVLLIMFPFLLSKDTPLIYSPPAVTKTGLPVLKDWIAYADNHPEYGNFYCHYRNWISHHLSKDLSEDEKEKIIKLRNRLFDVGFWQINKIDNMIMFYKNANVILPPGPGVLYSLDGENPNDSNDTHVVEAKPYTQIKGNWYMSRKLLLGGPRADVQISIPKALIDKSLSLEGIDPNELNIFSSVQESQVSLEGNTDNSK